MNNITLCLTIGKRPELLHQTLTSLLAKYHFENVIAINDFGDKETNDVFLGLCPHGILLNQENHIGHHRAVDKMYQYVTTDYIFHCEDDWYFDSELNIASYIELLKTDPCITSVCLRKILDFPFSDEDLMKVEYLDTIPVKAAKLTALHEQWHGYTFNPHIISVDTWKEIGNFSTYKKERHISRWLRKKGKYIFFLKEGVCYHIGENNSIANPPKTNVFVQMKAKIFG
ncbi:glycosyltransferase [Psychrobacter immobilis]|uniref:glycosyltransferase n=1 Tax=Psychrobacter immobilis TaxID=498 RepID=UPI00191A648E|nr:glycosyltransferase [Psychrobacter immobilis]